MVKERPPPASAPNSAQSQADDSLTSEQLEDDLEHDAAVPDAFGTLPSQASSYAAGLGLDVGDTLPSGAREGDLLLSGQIDHYELEERIGIGGMGEVFAARDLQTHERVALKTLGKATAKRLYRFKREFRALADVTHENLIQLFELAVPAQGPAYFTMELLEGQPFVAWVRDGAAEGELPQLDRLERAFAQLFAGINHLHQNDCVHRDLKPSNVLVTPAGRVVILDFGLVSELSEIGKGVTRDGQLVGTPAYMAPEQALGEPAGPAADYYSIGVMLYTCLTGEMPFGGSGVGLLVIKQTHDAPDPSSRTAGIPTRLRDLCGRLLAREPERRPRSWELPPSAKPTPTTSPLLAPAPRSAHPQRPPPPLVIGRERELASLHAALDHVRAHASVVVVQLHAPSGLGKSALVRRFRAELPDQVIALHGRCRARESMPYKGVDAVIDALSAYLHQLPADALAPLRPPDLDALVRVFPILDELWPVDHVQQLGPNELRKLGWNALRELLVRLAHGPHGRALLVHIDDFHWADADSVRLLHALLRGPKPPPMLLLIAFRDDLDPDGGASHPLPGGRAAPSISAAGPSAALRELEQLDRRELGDLRDLELAPLDEPASLELATILLRAQPRMDEPGLLQARAQAVALRAGGSPFFIGQMVLGGDSADAKDLDEIVIHRLTGLDPDARCLLEIIAVAGGPLPLTLALTLCPGANLGVIDQLCALELLVRSTHGVVVIETAHDRIRRLLLGTLTSAEQARLHHTIGRSLLDALLTERGLEALDDAIFTIVDHLDLGTPALDELSAEQRLELSQLNRLAGERALATTAWEPALRYLAFARALVEPWLEEARQGRGHHQLCLAICHAHAQALAMCEGPAADAVFDELLDAWQLSTAVHGEIIAGYLLLLRLQDRQADTVDVALAALARLGLEVPKHPSKARTSLEVLRGWRALGRLELDSLRALPQITDARALAAMNVLAVSLGSAVLVDARLYMTLAGVYARMVRRYGLHERTTYALSTLAFCVGVFGQPRRAGAMCERALSLAEHEPAPTESLVASRALAALFVWPACRPFAGVVREFEQLHDRACELDLGRTAGYFATIGAALHLEAGTPLVQLRDYMDHVEAYNPSLGGSELREIAGLYRRYVLALVDGDPVMRADELVSIYRSTRYNCVVVELCAAVLFGQFEQAWARVNEIAHDFERALLGNWNIPRFAMLSTIVIAERYPTVGWRERRRLRAAVRKYRSIARRFAANCPENYGPMAAIIEGELAGLRGRDDAAVNHFERARTIASATGVDYVVGLASERLAKVSRRRGHELSANAARQVALECYRRWGATAVVQRLLSEQARELGEGADRSGVLGDLFWPTR